MPSPAQPSPAPVRAAPLRHMASGVRILLQGHRSDLDVDARLIGVH
ncbi:hypothetical protein [Streptomyces sp. NBC_00932]|nr:hypothetical protein OG221_00725 [Streptomyces sp. NBC_00932]